MKIVLDTNVLVSGLLSPFNPPGRILSLLLNEKVQWCFDTRILEEYAEVLHRNKFSFAKDDVVGLLDFVEHRGLWVTANPLATQLPDPNDEPFLEVVIAVAADYLVTGNLKH